jgi:hypothetical protein
MNGIPDLGQSPRADRLSAASIDAIGCEPHVRMAIIHAGDLLQSILDHHQAAAAAQIDAA